MTVRPLNSDPLRNFRFHVQINHPTIASYPKIGFMSCSGLAIQSEVIPYREGGNNTTTRKMPGQTDFGPIGLSRGMMAAPVKGGTGVGVREAWDWFLQLFSVQEGQGKGGAGAEFRCGIDIDVLQHPITRGPGAPLSDTPAIKARIQVYNAWPMALAWSDLDAGGNAVIIEQLTLAHEGFRVLWATQGLGVGNFLGASAGNGNNQGV